MFFTLNISPQSVLFQIGNFRVHYYGLIMVTAILICIFIANRLARQKNIDLWKLDNLYFYLIIFGILGARLYEVLFFSWQYYQNNLLAIFKIWQGGLAIQGVIIAGIITVFVYSRKNKISFLKYASLLAVVLPLGQAIGRWGNFFNQELYGRMTSLPWAIYIENTNLYHHPLFLYESILNIILFIILYNIYKKGKFDQQVLFFYISGYGIIRFLMEFWRIDHCPLIFNIRLPQLVSLIAIIVGTALIFYPKIKK
ncbi:prolipoprotein diacylglyceryl transferase [bacterium]|nr:prolipoprotein diacylglyceryl transferase [bacterium]